MTGIISINPITIRHPLFPSLRFPKLGIGVAEILRDIGYTFNLACAQPYRPGRSQSPVILEGSEKGRDPNW